MQVRVLGPVEVVAGDGSLLAVGGRRPQALLAALALRAGERVAVSRLADDVWGDALPAHPTRAVQTYVSRLRSALGTERVVRSGQGYTLRLEDDELDLARFEWLAEQGRRELAASRPGAARRCLSEALALWRGEPLEGLFDGPLVAATRARLQEAWLCALEDRLAADLATGRHVEVIAELHGLVERHPLRESFRMRLMLALHRAGQSTQALEVFAAGRETLAAELGIDPSPQAVELHAAILRNEIQCGPDAARRGTVRAAARSHLPVTALASFVGRTRELATVAELLSRQRFVTISGAGGVGKTRLATEAARAWRNQTGHHVAFVDLTDAEPGHVPRALADAVGSHVDRADDVTAVLQQDLAARELLLLLDNCEHVVEEVGAIAEHLLENCPQLLVLATSRELLGRHGENVLPLRPLPVPDPDQAAGRDRYMSDAVQLFLDRARALDPDFTPSTDGMAAIERICQILAGIPLAIELAAARTRLLGCDEIARRLEWSHDVLARNDRTTPDRHRSLDAALYWSYDQLSDEEQKLLRRLAVAAGGFPISAVEHLHERSDGGRAALDVLASLVAQSMVETVAREHHPARFHLLDPIRRFTRARLTEAGEIARTRRDHACWILAVAEDADAEGQAAFATGADAVLTHEVDNMRAALRWSVEAGEARIAQRLVAAASSFWWANGHLREGTDHGRAALALPATTALSVRAGCLAGTALLENHDGRWHEGRQHAQEAVDLLMSHSPGSRSRHWARALIALAHALLYDGELDRSADAVRRGAEAAQTCGDRFAGLGAAVVTAAVAAARDDDRGAMNIFGDMATEARANDDAVSEIVANFNLGLLELHAGAAVRAAQHVEAVLARKIEADIDPFGHDHTHGAELLLLARTHAMQDRRDTAEVYVRQAIQAARRGGDHRTVDTATALLDELRRPLAPAQRLV